MAVHDRKIRTKRKVLRVCPVNIEVDETTREYLVFVSPRIEAQAMGIGYHRSRLPKCQCGLLGNGPGTAFRGKGSRCTWCRGWSADGMARYVGRLLRSYPKVRTVIEVQVPLTVKQIAERLAA